MDDLIEDLANYGAIVYHDMDRMLWMEGSGDVLRDEARELRGRGLSYRIYSTHRNIPGLPFRERRNLRVREEWIAPATQPHYIPQIRGYWQRWERHFNVSDHGQFPARLSDNHDEL